MVYDCGPYLFSIGFAIDFFKKHDLNTEHIMVAIPSAHFTQSLPGQTLADSSGKIQTGCLTTMLCIEVIMHL